MRTGGMPRGALPIPVTIASVPTRRKAMALVAALGACALPRALPCGPVATSGPRVWVLDHGWHTDLALAVADLKGPLAAWAGRYVGAQALVFGFGKRSYLLALAGAPAEYLLGAVPGPGAVEVKGLGVSPAEAYPERAIALALPPGGAARLSDFLWSSMRRDASDQPVPALPEPLRGSLFLEATHGYSLAYTCNTWTATALRAAGLPIEDRGVVLAGAVLGQLPALAGACVAGGRAT